MKELDDITGAVVDAAIKIHKELGPGLLESVYEVVLARELQRRGFRVERQKPIRFEYDGMIFEEGFRVDLLVEGRVIVEIKSVENLAAVHSKQLLTYLRLMNLSVGLLINFGETLLKEGLHRVVNNLSPSASPLLRVNQSADPMNQAEAWPRPATPPSVTHAKAQPSHESRGGAKNTEQASMEQLGDIREVLQRRLASGGQ